MSKPKWYDTVECGCRYFPKTNYLSLCFFHSRTESLLQLMEQVSTMYKAEYLEYIAKNIRIWNMIFQRNRRLYRSR